MQIVAIVGGDDGDAGFLGEPHEVFVYALLNFQALVLNFEEKVAFAEDVAEAIGVLARESEFFLHHRLGDWAAKAGRQCDEALAVFREQVEINARLVIEAFEEAGGDQLDEIVIALEIFAKQNEVVAAARTWLHFTAIAVGHRRGFFAAVVAAAFGDVDFAADDGLDVAFAGFIEKVGGGEQISVVGDGPGGPLLAGCVLAGVPPLSRALQKKQV